jgi:stage III sporulation protein AB
MMVKLIGACLIFAACGGMGMSVATAHKQKEHQLQQLIAAVRLMACELEYRQTPLPQLMRICGESSGGVIGRVFALLAAELERQLAPDAACCMASVVAQMKKLPTVVQEKLLQLGRCLGRFDLSGQLSGLKTVEQLCQRDLDGLLINRDARLRSYMTLGLCGGLALVILFV